MRRPARAGWLAGALALLAAGIVIALVARPDSAPAAHYVSPLQVIGGKPLQEASCQQWMAGSPDERAALLAALRANVGGSTPYGRGTTLSDSAATALFNRACIHAYAQGFMLYVIYARAAAFQYTPQHFQ